MDEILVRYHNTCGGPAYTIGGDRAGRRARFGHGGWLKGVSEATDYDTGGATCCTCGRKIEQKEYPSEYVGLGPLVGLSLLRLLALCEKVRPGGAS